MSAQAYAGRGENPYPQGPPLVRPFAPATVAAPVPAPAPVVPAAPVFTPVEAAPLPVRERGASLAGPVPFGAPEPNLALMERTVAGLKRIPRAGEKIFAAAVAGHYGTGAQPAADLEPAAGDPEPGGTLLRDLLADAFWLAAQWYADIDEGDVVKSRTYADLCDAVKTAPTDGAALDMVRAALAEGTAELGDITAGSLEQIGDAR